MPSDAPHRQKPDYLRAILESVPVLITSRLRDGTYSAVFSDLQIFDYASQRDLVGKKTQDVLNPTASDIITTAVREALDTGEYQNVEFPVNIGGEQFWRFGRLAPLDTPENRNSEEVVMVTVDYTKQKEREIMLYEVLKILGTYTTRSGLQQAFCERLVEKERYEAAWLGEYTEMDGLTVHATANAEEYLETLRERCDSLNETDDPGVRSLRTGETYFIECDTQSKSQWSEAAEAHDIQVAAGLPLNQNGVFHGVLAVYLSDAEYLVRWRKDLLELYAEKIGYALSGALWRWALATNTTTTLELTVSEGMVLLEFCRCGGFDSECRITSVLPRSEETIYYIENPEYDNNALIKAAQETACMRPLDESPPDREVSAVVVESETPEGKIGDLGLTFERFLVSSQEATIVATAPKADAVRSVFELFRENYPNTNISVKWTEEDSSTDPLLDSNIASLLTERQYEALVTAYRYGYFDKNRKHNATEIAEKLDISRWTFSEHLRLAQRKLLTHLLD